MTRPHDFKEWHRRQIDEYSKNEFPIYELYADVLERVLKRVCSEHAKLGIVQSRPKAVSSLYLRATYPSTRSLSAATMKTQKEICSSHRRGESADSSYCASSAKKPTDVISRAIVI